MKDMRLKRTRSRVNKRPLYPVYALCALCVLAVVALVAVIILNSRSVTALSNARARLSERTQQEINLALRAYDRIDLPGADLRGDILPEMRKNIYAAAALNQTFIDTYGMERAVAAPQTFTAMNDAIDRLDAAIQAGQTGTNEREQLKSAVLAIETEMAQRLAGSDLLQHKSALM